MADLFLGGEAKSRPENFFDDSKFLTLSKLKYGISICVPL